MEIQQCLIPSSNQSLENWSQKTGIPNPAPQCESPSTAELLDSGSRKYL